MRPPKETLGHIACPMCGREGAAVRRMETRKRLAEGQAPPRQGGYVGSLYVYCAEPDGSPRCGVVQAPGAAAQAAISAKARWLPGKAPTDPRPKPPAPAAKAALAAKAAQAAPPSPAAAQPKAATPTAKRFDPLEF